MSYFINPNTGKRVYLKKQPLKGTHKSPNKKKKYTITGEKENAKPLKYNEQAKLNCNPPPPQSSRSTVRSRAIAASKARQRDTDCVKAKQGLKSWKSLQKAKNEDTSTSWWKDVAKYADLNQLLREHPEWISLGLLALLSSGGVGFDKLPLDIPAILA